MLAKVECLRMDLPVSCLPGPWASSPLCIGAYNEDGDEEEEEEEDDHDHDDGHDKRLPR